MKNYKPTQAQLDGIAQHDKERMERCQTILERHKQIKIDKQNKLKSHGNTKQTKAKRS